MLLDEIRSSGPRKASRSSAPASRATDSASARSSPGRHAATAGRCAGQSRAALELGGERDEPRLGVGRADELDGEREAVGREARRAPTRRAGRCG